MPRSNDSTTSQDSLNAEDRTEQPASHEAREEPTYSELEKLGHFTPWTDAGNAEIITQELGDVLRFDHKRGCWYLWYSHSWHPDKDEGIYRLALNLIRSTRLAADKALWSDIEQVDASTLPRRLEGALKALKDLARDLSTRARKYEDVTKLNAMIRLAKTMAPISDGGEDWDRKTGIVGCPNGVIDLRTGELRDGRREDWITMQLGVEFDADAKCPRFDDFMLEIHDYDKDVVQYLYRLLGAALAGEAAALQLFLFLMGHGGNGKGAEGRALLKVFGDYGDTMETSVLEETARDAHTTVLKDMEHKRLLLCTELGSHATINVDRLKSFSGGDTIKGRGMRENNSKFVPTWLMMISTNETPTPEDNSKAWHRRQRVINMPGSFNPKDEPTLEAVLEAEGPGILNRLVAGAVEFYAAGQSEGELPEAVAEANADYEDETNPDRPWTDPVWGFLVEADTAYFTPLDVIWKAYNVWCQQTDAVTGLPRIEPKYRSRTAAKLAVGHLYKHYGRGRHEILEGEEPVRQVRRQAGVYGVRIRAPFEGHDEVWETKSGPLAPNVRCPLAPNVR